MFVLSDLLALILYVASHGLLCGCQTEICFHCFDFAILHVDRQIFAGAPIGLKWHSVFLWNLTLQPKEIFSDT